jgi:hypothetical protein
MARLRTLGWVAFAAAVLGLPADTFAQSAFGIGPRVSFVKGSSELGGSQRFSGGFIRLGGGHAALEAALDYRSALTGDLVERVTDLPIQVSLLLFPVRATLAPYVLGGVGWYAQHVERLAPGGTVVLEEKTTRKMGYHAGFGAEIRVHRHVGLHGDYRYTFLRLGDDERAADRPAPPLIPFAERLKLTHQGSMFTWGATFYF